MNRQDKRIQQLQLTTAYLADSIKHLIEYTDNETSLRKLERAVDFINQFDIVTDKELGEGK